MRYLTTGLRWFVWGLHAVAGLTVLLLMIVTIVDITGRYSFSRPFPGTVELTQLGMVLVVFLALAFTEREGGHITVDILYERMPMALQRVVGTLAQLVGIAVVAVGGWKLLGFQSQMQGGGYTTPVLGIGIHALAYAAAAGMLLYGLTMVANLLRSLAPQAGGAGADEPEAPKKMVL